MNQSALLDGLSVKQCLFQRIKEKFYLGGPQDPPSHDATNECVDDECHIDKALLCEYVGKVADPQRDRMQRPDLYASSRWHH